VDSYGKTLIGSVMYYEKAVDAWRKISQYPSVKELEKRGVTVDVMSPLAKIVDIKERKPSLYRKIRWIVPVATWISYRLCYGENHVWRDIYTDYTNTLKFGLYITSKPLTWFRPVYDELGIDLSIMPTLVECGTYICSAKSDYASLLALEGAEVYHGMTDGNVAALTDSAIDIGNTNIYSRTTTVPKLVTDRVIPHKALYYHIHPIKQVLQRFYRLHIFMVC